jgi:rhodanese-related sulfurtransferase
MFMIKMKKIRQLTLITIAITFLAGLPVNTLADRNSIDPKIRFEQAAAKLQKQDHSCLISAQSVLQRLKLGKKIMLVDIRNQEEFAKLSIPGAINIPLHFVKSKSFLKSKPIVLVDGGYTDRQTEETCKALRHEGFRVSILSGGLISWHRQGGPVKGDLLALNRYKNISPLRFYREKNRKDQIIINVSEKQHAESMQLMPGAKHIPVQVSSQTAVSQVEKSILKQNINPFFPVVIFNQTGEQYEPIENIIKKAGLKNVYFLKGGLKGYQKFLKHLALSRQPRESRIKAANRCGNCGPQKEKE